MKINKVLAEIGFLIVEEQGEDALEQRIREIGYQVREYERQEKCLQEIFEHECLDMTDYISMKMAKIEAIKEMLQCAITKRTQIERECVSTKNKMKKGKAEQEVTLLQKGMVECDLGV